MRRKKLKTRKYEDKDIGSIVKLGKLLNDNFEFKLDVFSRCLIAIENDALIGFVIYSIIYDRSEIVDIIIDPSYRRKGYGKGLLEQVIEILKKEECLNVTLEVRCDNLPALKLYQSLGFKVKAVRKNYYDGTNGYLMEKDLRC